MTRNKLYPNGLSSGLDTALNKAYWIGTCTRTFSSAFLLFDNAMNGPRFRPAVKTTLLVFAVAQTTLAQTPSPVSITSIQSISNAVQITWTGGSGPFAVQHRANFAESWCTCIPFVSGDSALVAQPEIQGFFRVIDVATKNSSFAVSLNGAAERPTPVAGGGSGSGSGSVNTNGLSFTFSYNSLSGPATAVRLHGPATRDESANAFADLTPFIVNTTNNVGGEGTTNFGGHLSGSVILTPEQKLSVLNGLTYVNLCTAAHTNGEIRGQLTASMSGIVLCPTAGSFTNIITSYLEDGWLISGNYGSGFWASAAVFGSFNVRSPFL